MVYNQNQAGRLHLVDKVGKIPLADATLVEDPNEEERNDDGKNTVQLCALIFFRV